MAKGRKTGGRNFAPGNKMGNGRPRIPVDLREAREANRVKFLEIATRYLEMPRGNLREIINDPSTPNLEAIVATIIIKAIGNGDTARLGFLLDRTLGKEAEKIDITSKMGLLGLLKSLESEE